MQRCFNKNVLQQSLRHCLRNATGCATLLSLRNISPGRGIFFAQGRLNCSHNAVDRNGSPVQGELSTELTEGLLYKITKQKEQPFSRLLIKVYFLVVFDLEDYDSTIQSMYRHVISPR